MINKLFIKCYMSIDFIPDTNPDRKVAKAALLTSLFVLGIIHMFYGLYCLILNSTYNKTIIIIMIMLSVFGTYFYYVTNNRGRNIVYNAKGNKNKRIGILILTSFLALGLFLINIVLIDQLS